MAQETDTTVHPVHQTSGASAALERPADSAARESVLAKVLEIAGRFARDGAGTWDCDQRLSATGVLDSLGMIHLILALEEHYAIEFADSELDLAVLQTPRRMAEVVWSKLTVSGHGRSRQA